MTTSDEDGWKRFVFEHFKHGQLDASVATAYMEEYDIELADLIAGCFEVLIREDSSRMREMVVLHESVFKEIESRKTMQMNDEKKIRMHLGAHLLIVPINEISSATKEQKKDIRLMVEVYEKYKKAFANVEECYEWESCPLELWTGSQSLERSLLVRLGRGGWDSDTEPDTKDDSEPTSITCLLCDKKYALIGNNFNDCGDRTSEDIYIEEVCYHCEKEFLDLVEKKVHRDLMQDNVRTIRDTIQVFKDAIEVEESTREV